MRWFETKGYIRPTYTMFGEAGGEPVLTTSDLQVPPTEICFTYEWKHIEVTERVYEERTTGSLWWKRTRQVKVSETVTVQKYRILSVAGSRYILEVLGNPVIETEKFDV